MSARVRPAFARTLWVAGIGPGEHEEGVVADHAHRMHPGPRSEPELVAASPAHQEGRAGTVGDLRGVAGRDAPAHLGEPLRQLVGLEDRAQLPELLDRAAGSDRLVTCERASGRDHGHDLAVEGARLLRGGGEAVGADRELVELGARQLPAGGHELGGHPLRDESRREPLGDAGAVGIGTCPGGAHHDPAHRLHAAGDRDVVRAGLDPLRREVKGLLARAALAVDGRGRHVGGKPCPQPGHPSWRCRLLAHLGDAAHQDVVDGAGVQCLGPAQERLDGLGEQVDRMHVGQPAARTAAPGCRADDVDDHGVAGTDGGRHGYCLS